MTNVEPPPRFHSPRFHYYGHACVAIQCAGYTLLTDPWFGTPVGNLYAYPPLEPPTDDWLRTIDALHISHLHGDHFSRPALERFSKEIPIFISSFRQPRLRTALQNVGFKNITEIPPGLDGVNAGPFTLLTLQARPVTEAGDSVLILRVGGKSYFLNNDCNLPHLQYGALRRSLGTFEGGFLGYSDISPYPTCFNFSECASFHPRLAEDEVLKDVQRSRLAEVSRICKEMEFKWIVPYASSLRLRRRDLLSHNRLFMGREQVETIDSHGAKMIWPEYGDVIANGETVVHGPRRHLSTDPIPELWIQPAPNNSSATAPPSPEQVAHYENFFFRVIAKESQSWATPMTIEVNIVDDSHRSTFCYRFDGKTVHHQAPGGTSDVVIEYPGQAIRDCIEGRTTLIRIHHAYVFHARILKFVPNQMSVHTWTL